jgi:hypothetical protein
LKSSDGCHAANLSGFIGRRQHLCPALLAQPAIFNYFASVKWLTKQEQLVLCAVIGLLLTGWVVKYIRAVHQAPPASQTANF